MSFDGSEGTSIALSTASDWTENWRDDEPNYTKAVFFGRDNIETILDQSGCEGIRCYFAKNASGAVTLVLVGADSGEDDQIGRGDLILDGGIPCPERCGENNALNS